MEKPLDEKIAKKEPELVAGRFEQTETSFGEDTQENMDFTLVMGTEESASPEVTAKVSRKQERVTDVEIAATAKDKLVGQVFDNKYKILGVVGSGGMSVVYKAMHIGMNKVVALKLMHKHLLLDERAVSRFQKEARSVAALSHAGVIRIYDFGVSADDDPYIAMEYLEGQSLSDRLHECGPLDGETAVSVFKGMAEALSHAHQQKVVHRDLKPSNIVLTEDPKVPGRLKPTVVDFGIAKLTVEDGADNLKLTATGEIWGSPFYMSPEQCLGREADHRSDIYSFGCLMYEAITGKPPFEAWSAVAIIQQHTSQEAPRFKTLGVRPDVSDGLEAIILKCLEKVPQDRYQSMDDLVKALDLLGDKGSVPVLMRARRKQNMKVLVTALLMVLIAVPLLVTQWHLVFGQALFFVLVLLLTGWGSFSMFQRFFRMHDAMKFRSPSLNYVQKVRLSFTLAMAVIMSVWSVGMMVYVASKATQNPLIDALAQWLWLGSLVLVGGYFVGVIVFAAVAAIAALSNEST